MCKLNAATVAADGKVLGNTLEQIAAAVAPTNPALATQLNTAAQGIITATANWQEGDATAALEDAEQVVDTALALIPLTAPYAALVAIAFDGLNLLLANTKTQPAQATAPTAMARTMIVARVVTANPNPWNGKANIEHTGDLRKDYKNAWNAGVDALAPKIPAFKHI